MKNRRIRVWVGIVGAAFWAIGPCSALAQTFSSGSTGVNGAYTATCSPTPCTVTEPLPASGVFNYTTVTIPAGVTVQYTRNAANTPVTILATGDVNVVGNIFLSGGNAIPRSTSGTVPFPGALGGPGGFNGGNGGVLNGVMGTAGQGPGGGTPALVGCCSANPGSYGAPTAFVALIPLFGGSGGGGATVFPNTGATRAGSGAGGGGAILIASSSKITVSGSITANGGTTTQQNPVFCAAEEGAPGSGGAIRLVAPLLEGNGTLQANGGTGGCSALTPGRIRFEAFTQGISGSISPAASFSTPGPVTASSNPSLVNLPRLAIASMGGVAAPEVPGGSYASADVSLVQGTSNPVTVTLAAANTPVGSPTAITLKLMPQTAFPTTLSVPTANHTGTFASSTATVGVTFPAGQVSMIQAWATMTLTGQIASLMPLIDGEPIERVQVAASQGAPSALSLVTRSGKEVRVDQLTREDQLRVAQAWEVMRATRVE